MAPPAPHRLPLPESPDPGPYRGREGKIYRPSADLVAAANVALVLEAPLLLTGEPGCGKTDFAWAAASALAAAYGTPPKVLNCYVRSDTTARDLLYHYDAVRRFGDAQHGGPEGKARAADARHYIQLGHLGEALMSRARRVVLIDEIDKAPRDLPNDLLRELDQGHFEIPEIPRDTPGCIEWNDIALTREMKRPEDVPRPLVIITSNIERQLPDAFLRRCVFFEIPFPTQEDDLRRIVREHLGDDAAGEDGLIGHAIQIFLTLRSRGPKKKPATAELLHWMRALLHATPDLGATRKILRATSEALGAGRRIAWRKLPALGCLLKTREDIEAVERREPA